MGMFLEEGSETYVHDEVISDTWDSSGFEGLVLTATEPLYSRLILYMIISERHQGAQGSSGHNSMGFALI